MAVLIHFGVISLNVGIIIGVLAAIIPIVLAILPTLIEYGLKPKVTLKINDMKLIKRNSHDVEGYQLEALVTNHGKKICLNMCATFVIKDAHGNSPNLLHVRFDSRKGQTVEQNEEPMRAVRYAWGKEDERIYVGNWGELRQKDSVSLLFPHETIGGGTDSYTFWSETLLKLTPNSRYEVKVEVKGEDSEKNTAIGNKKQTLTAQMNSTNQ